MSGDSGPYLVYIGREGDPAVVQWFERRRRENAKQRRGYPPPALVCDPIRVEPCRAKNIHHLLFFKRKWKMGYAGELREHEYFKVELPVNVHNELHARMNVGIPCPDGQDCKRMLAILESALKTGEVDLVMDSPVRRIDFVERLCCAMCPETAAWLEVQRRLLIPFSRAA